MSSSNQEIPDRRRGVAENGKKVTGCRKFGDQHFLTPRQIQGLKSGPRVDVFVGPVGDQFIAIEGAYKSVLTHFSGRAKRDLASFGVTRFNIPNASKNVICWIYRFMLAGEKNPDKDKFEDFDMPYLILVYSHAEILEYTFLMNKTFKRLQYFIANVGLLDVNTMKSLATFIPGLRKTLADSLAYTICDRVVPFDWTYIHEVHSIENMGDNLDSSIQNRLNVLIARSHWYYGQLQMKNKSKFSNAQHNVTTAIARPPRKLKGNKKSVTTLESQASLHPTENQKPKKTKRNKKAKFTQATKIQDIGPQEPVDIHDPAPASKGKASCHKQKARKPSNKLVTRTVESQSENAAHTKVIDHTPLPKKQPISHKQSTDLNCYNCGDKGHVSRECPVQPPDKERLYPNKPTREAIICYNCNGSGHIARDCVCPSRESVRKPTNCYNCNLIGHIARNCPALVASSKSQEGSEFVKAQCETALNGDGDNCTYNPSKARASVYVGRNRNRRRANAERYTDRYNGLIMSGTG